MEVTRRSILSATLREKEMELKSFSLGFRGLEARRGCEKEFARYQKECRILRELIQALDNDKVRAAIAEFLEEEPKEEPLKAWQIKVLRGEKKAGLFGYIPRCCIECFDLRHKFDDKGCFEGYYCRLKPELFGDYDKCYKERMEGCPLNGHKDAYGDDHPEGR